MNKQLTRSALTGFLLFATSLGLPKAAEAQWTAYNDMAWLSPQTTTRVTRLGFVDDADHDLSGALVRYDNGVTSGVSIAFSGAITPGFSDVTAVGAGTPAGLLFDGKVDTTRSLFIPTGSTGTITLTGMNASKTYRIAVLGNRGEPTYTSRTTALTLSGADSFINSSSAGATISGSLNETTTITTGTNTGGLVFIYTDISPGVDGQVQLSVSGNPGNSLYLNTLLVEELPAAVSTWTAYNDCAWASGQTNYRITRLTFLDDADHDTSGQLIRNADGQLSGVTMSFAGGVGAGYSAASTQIGAGSPADLIFNGKINVTNAVFLPSSISGTVTLTGLSSTRRYKVALFGNRGDTSYVSRVTIVSLIGADSFINSSSAGAVISGAQNETTTITTGTNTGGLVYLYTDIQPGVDGSIQFALSGASGFSSYMSAMMVELLSEDPAPPSVANSSATIISPVSATLSGSLTSTGVSPTEVWLYWEQGTDAGTNKAAWTSVVSLGFRTTGVLSHTLTNLAASTSYSYRYYASNGLGQTWATPAISFTTPATIITSSVPFGVASRRQHYASNRRGGIVISEIMYAPRATHGDDAEFVELYNSSSYAEDLSGWELSGEVDFTFTNGAAIPARSYLVVAKNPSWLEGSYQITGVVGPYSNRLSNGGGLVRLKDAAGAILFEVEYNDGGEWPLAAGGAGHSLVLTRPDYGEGDVKAWEASAVMYGNPGRSNQTISAGYRLQNVCINEAMTHTDPPQEDYIELFNRGTGSVDLAGCWLSDSANTFKYQISSGTLAATSCIAFTQTQLGFGLSRQGGSLYLFNPAQDLVVDAISYEAQENGVSFGRYPDGAPGLHDLTSVTTGRVNRTSSLKIRDIVINEIMYNPPSGDSDDEFIELHNRSGSPVNVGYWRFITGVEYMFPAGTTIPAGSYAIIARDRLQFLGKYTNVSSALVYGDYTGSLSDRGENLTLAKPDDIAYPYQDFVVMDEVRYADGWTDEADGGGSSLELRDPHSDNRLAASWADSDESLKAPWTVVEVQAHLDAEDCPDAAAWDTNTGDVMYPYYLKQLQIFLNGSGECLIDEVHVTRGGTGEWVKNPTVDTGTNDWIITHGNHKESIRLTSNGVGNTACIQLKAQGGGNPGVNSLGVNLNSGLAPNDQNVKLSLKARWLRGSPSLSARMVGNGLWAAGLLVLPDLLGTPGAQNSRYAANVGPDITELFYSPVLPAAGSNVTVTVRLQDVDGLQGADIKWRLDPSGTYNTTNMNDSGTGVDAVANDGLWSGRIPGQALTNVVGFYISARDNNGATIRQYPEMAPTQEVYVMFGATNGAVGDYGVFRMIVPPSRDKDASAGTYWTWDRMDNMYWDVTLIYNDSRIIPNAGTRLGGSNLSRPKPGLPYPWWDPINDPAPNYRQANQTFRFKLPKENRLCGSTAFALDNLNNQNRARIERSPCDPTFVLEDVMGWMARELGLKATRQRYMHLFGNDYHKGIIFADIPSPSDDFIDGYLPDSTDGDTYESKSWDETAKTLSANSRGDVNDNENGAPWDESNTDANRPYSMIKAWKHDDGALRPEMYRMTWDKKPLHPRDIDVSSILTVAQAVDRPIDSSAGLQRAYLQGLDKVIDWEQWARSFAFRHVISDEDNWGVYGRNKYMHIPKGGKAILLDFDYDSGLGLAPQYGDAVDGNRSDGSGSVFCGWGSSLTKVQDLVLSNQFMKCYAVQRAYWRGVKDMVDGPMLAARANVQMDKLFMAHSNNNIEAWKNMKAPANDSMAMTAAELAEAKAWTAKRRDFILNDAGTPFTASLTNTAFSATASGTTTGRVFQVSGNAPIQARTLKVNGVAIPADKITWTSVMAYTMDVTAITNGTQNYLITAWENNGNQVGSGQSLNVNYTGSVTAPSGQLVITEIMYDPMVSDGGFVEIYNKHATEAIDLTGLRLNGADFIFPAGAVIGPQQYKVLVASESVFFGAYTNDASIVIGAYSGTLDNGGETLSLDVPAGLTNVVVTNMGSVVTNVFTNYVTIDTVTYEDDAPWPSEVRGSGHSLQLIDPNQDNDRLANWTTARRWKQVTMTGTATTTTLYLYFDGGAMGPVLFDDITLVTGLVAGVGMNLVTNGSFDEAYPGQWSVAPAYAESVVLGGIGRDGGDVLKMVATSVDTTGIRQNIPSIVTGRIHTLSFWYLPLSTGGNFRVRFSGSWVDSTNSLAMGLSSTPGRANVGAGTLNAIPTVWVSEIMPDNSGSPTDNMGDSDAWLELFNSDSSTYNLTSSNFYLTGDYDNLTQWAFPNSPTLSAGARRLIWLDGETGETSGTNHLHTSFLADPGTGHVALVQINNGRTTVVDYVNYTLIPVNKSYGNYPDSNSMMRIIFDSPTPSAVNNPISQTNLSIRINEWCAVNKNVLADPADGQFEDWIELYNPNGQAVDLSGWMLTDDLEDPGKYVIPSGRSIPAMGHLLIWADNESSQTTAATDLHAPFSLSANGEQLGLFRPDGQQIEYIVFAGQADNISEGRYPDGTTEIYPMAIPTPSTTNKLFQATSVISTGGVLRITWNVRPSMQYRLMYSDSLTSTNWTAVGADMQTNATSMTFDLPISTVRRFYRMTDI